MSGLGSLQACCPDVQRCNDDCRGSGGGELVERCDKENSEILEVPWSEDTAEVERPTSDK